MVERVLVVGSGGAGKTTFSLALAERTGLPVVHLDAHFWRPGWVQPSSEEWAEQVDRLAAEPRWIMDGNYGGTMDRRLAACDTVVVLDPPRLLCVWRVVKRRLKHHGATRPDLAPGCPERLTMEFIRWIWSYPQRKRPTILEKLARLRPDQRAIVVRSQADIEAFLAWAGADGTSAPSPPFTPIVP